MTQMFLSEVDAAADAHDSVLLLEVGMQHRSFPVHDSVLFA